MDCADWRRTRQPSRYPNQNLFGKPSAGTKANRDWVQSPLSSAAFSTWSAAPLCVSSMANQPLRNISSSKSSSNASGKTICSFWTPAFTIAPRSFESSHAALISSFPPKQPRAPKCYAISGQETISAASRIRIAEKLSLLGRSLYIEMAFVAGG